MHKTPVLKAALLDAPAPGRVRYEPEGYLRLDAEGRIVDRSATPPQGDVDLIDLSGRLIIPGLIDLHSHLSQFGAEARPAGRLLPWLNDVILPVESALADPKLARRCARAFFAACLRSGITTSVLYGPASPEACRIAFEEAERAGGRTVMGPVLMDRKVPPDLKQTPQRIIDDCLALCRRWHGRHGRLYFAFVPRFAVACSRQLLEMAGRAARQTGAFVQTHLSENPEEIETVRKLFPDAPDYASVYDRAGLLTDRTILAHCLHLSPAEWKLIAGRGCRVAHCPRSNFFLRSGLFDAAAATRSGTRFGLGTDLAAGPSLDLFDEMRAAIWTAAARAAILDGPQYDLSPVAALHAATAAAGAALGLAPLGALDPGAPADLTVLKAQQFLPWRRSLRDLTPTEAAAMVVYRAGAHHVSQVWACGQLLQAAEPR